MKVGSGVSMSRALGFSSALVRAMLLATVRK
jgi:hypothetical protein